MAACVTFKSIKYSSTNRSLRLTNTITPFKKRQKNTPPEARQGETEDPLLRWSYGTMQGY
ncbi:hypothetical protein [Parabacteroides goldsteinii]